MLQKSHQPLSRDTHGRSGGYQTHLPAHCQRKDSRIGNTGWPYTPLCAFGHFAESCIARTRGDAALRRRQNVDNAIMSVQSVSWAALWNHKRVCQRRCVSLHRSHARMQDFSTISAKIAISIPIDARYTIDLRWSMRRRWKSEVPDALQILELQHCQKPASRECRAVKQWIIRVPS